MIIVWFRQDLRIADHPALLAAIETGQSILPVYILDDDNAGDHAMGGASRWWLHHSLKALNDQFDGRLCFLRGAADRVLYELAEKTSAQGVYWGRCYEPWRITRDKKIKAHFKDQSIDAKSFNTSFLWEPAHVLKDDGTPYRVFTPYYRKGCLQKSEAPAAPSGDVDLSQYDICDGAKYGMDLDDYALLPEISWDSQFYDHWQPGESGAQVRLSDFLEEGLQGYKKGRDFPAKVNVSRLSPHLHFGEISPCRVWYDAQAAMVAQGCEGDGDHFLSELGWREFSAYLLYHFPKITKENFQPKFDYFAWNDPCDDDALHKWQRGLTGYPIVDAGMAELWQTGYMHNRVRMVVGSFLVKHLRLDWRHGEAWFWDCLVDADLANNCASWQWVAGCGADAAPYFRIFNPITQATKFDESGKYIKKYVPVLKDLPDKYLGAPWEAPDHVLSKAGIILGQNYPRPIVDHKEARELALAAFQDL